MARHPLFPMLKSYRKPLRHAFLTVDLLIIVLSAAAVYIRFGPSGAANNPSTYLVPTAVAAYIATWILICRSFEVYSSKRTTSFQHETRELIKATAFCQGAAIIPLMFIPQGQKIETIKLFIIYLWPIQAGALILFRVLLRQALRNIRRRGYDYRQILVVGRNPRSDELIRKIENSPEYGLRILGIIDAFDNDFKHEFDDNFLGDLSKFESILREHVVDEVFITLPVKSFYSEISSLIALCEEVGIEAKIPTELFSLRSAKSRISTFAECPVIDWYTCPDKHLQLAAKRAIDILISTCLIILLLPLFAAVAVAIRLSSRGPVFFGQKRVGRNGRIFTCIKFRTMVENAEALKAGLRDLNEVSGPVFKIREDPRLTKVGRFLRKTSIDELPQLINVFVGDMSLVGPRPPLPEEVSQYHLRDRRRLSFKPGITCLWQVHGRSSLSFDRWMELDREYMDNWSLMLDLSILIKTIPAVIRGNGAA